MQLTVHKRQQLKDRHFSRFQIRYNLFLYLVKVHVVSAYQQDNFYDFFFHNVYDFYEIMQECLDIYITDYSLFRGDVTSSNNNESAIFRR
jgi:hypothetical protein